MRSNLAFRFSTEAISPRSKSARIIPTIPNRDTNYIPTTRDVLLQDTPKNSFYVGESLFDHELGSEFV